MLLLPRLVWRPQPWPGPRRGLRLRPGAGARPPYGHMVQLGDPVLRRPCRALVRGEVQGAEVQKVLAAMRRVLARCCPAPP